MKQSCYFAKVCDCEFNKKYICVNFFSLQLCLHEYMLTILCHKDIKCVSICWGLLLEDSGAIARSFDISFPIPKGPYMNFALNRSSGFREDAI